MAAADETRERRAARMDTLAAVAPAVQHDVNNAMMVLASNIELLTRAVPAEGPPRRQLDRIGDAARRVDQAVRAMLSVVRRAAEDADTVPPDAPLRALEPLLRIVLGARIGLDVAVAEGGVWPVRLDRARLDVALVALARDLMGRMAPGSKVEIALRNREEAGEVELRVALPAGTAPPAEPVREALRAAAPSVAEEEGGALVSLRWPRAG